jgi:hypothetical protein
LGGQEQVARYFDRAWLIYNGAETAVYADLASTRSRGAATSWHGTLIGPVNWSRFLQSREELELRSLAGVVGRFYVSAHQASADRAEVTGIGAPPF